MSYKIASGLALSFALGLGQLANAHADTFYQLGSPCNPITVATCGLPYPSDIFAQPDDTSPTGMRLEYPAGVVPEELLEEVPPSLTPQTVFNGSSGYSAATSVLFELDSPPDLETIPSDGGENLIAFDLDTGERIPLRVQLNEYARSYRVAARSQIIEIYPRARWQFGHRYGVYLTKSVKPEAGGNYSPSNGFMEAISDSGEPLANYYEPVISFYENQGYRREDLLSATFFTVRDEQEATGPLINLSEYVYDLEHPVRKLKIQYKLFGNIGAYVYGEVLAHNFRDEYGGMRYDIEAAEENWLKFRLTLPRSAKNKPAPVAIYGHGLGLLKETDFIVAIENAKLGIATIAIDHPNHGSRMRKDGGYVLFRLSTPNVPLQVGMVVQTSVDHIGLLKAIQTSLADIDVLPKRFWSPLVTRRIKLAGDGVADLDTSNIFYQGTSLGGVLGSAFVSLAPDLKGAFLQVTGVGITNILANSTLWDPMFSHLEPDAANGAEAMLLKAAMQHELDYGDAVNFVHYLKDPIPFSDAKPVVVMAGAGDNIVPNFSTVAFSEIVDIPLVGEELFPLPGVAHTADYVDGYGVIQFPSLTDTRNDIIDGLFAHGSFAEPEVTAAMRDWIKRYILEE